MTLCLRALCFIVEVGILVYKSFGVLIHVGIVEVGVVDKPQIAKFGKPFVRCVRMVFEIAEQTFHAVEPCESGALGGRDVGSRQRSCEQPADTITLHPSGRDVSLPSASRSETVQ